MARQFFPEKEEEFIQDQLSSFYNSLKIGNDNSNIYNNNNNNFSGNKNFEEKELSFDDLENNIKNSMSNLDENIKLFGENGDYESLLNEMNFQNYTDVEYKFSTEENEYLNKENCMEIGLKLKEKGDLHQSILAFEAEVKQNPKNEEAWRLLGNTHAECDNDNLAIGALIKASELDPENLDTLLDLSCSYTNNFSRFGALNNLKKWLQNHPLYGSLDFKTDKEISLKELEKEVLDLFILATEKDSTDASLYTALGVLYSIKDDTDMAEKSFKSALELNSESHTLWNKYGATLANNKKTRRSN